MTKRLLPFVFALALGATACGPNTYRVAGANQFAATDATITVDEDRGNYVTEIELRFLPPPARVAEGTAANAAEDEMIPFLWKHARVLACAEGKRVRVVLTRGRASVAEVSVSSPRSRRYTFQVL